MATSDRAMRAGSTVEEVKGKIPSIFSNRVSGSFNARKANIRGRAGNNIKLLLAEVLGSLMVEAMAAKKESQKKNPRIDSTMN